MRFAPARYDGELFCGTNYRMSELEAAVDVVQLAKTPDHRRALPRGQAEHSGQAAHLPRDHAADDSTTWRARVGYLLRFFPQTQGAGAQDRGRAQGRGPRCRHAPRGRRRPTGTWLGHMFPITGQRGPTAENCPFACPIYRERGGQVEYKRGDWPVAEDLFERVVSVPLNQWYTPEDCQIIADTLNTVFARYCTADEGATRWL